MTIGMAAADSPEAESTKSIQIIRRTVTTTTTVRRVQTIKPPLRQHVGLLVSGELDKAIANCKREVQRISKECKESNTKFRDREFDLLGDQEKCVHGLSVDRDEDEPQEYNVRRVTDIFSQPHFFTGGPRAGDVYQGALGDCWFLSALALIATRPKLVESFCVARDESVGVYGFIFFKNYRWESVVVDDFLLWSLPKFEELTAAEQLLYHNSKAIYYKSTATNGRGLLYARSGLAGETWVPLAEKAFAKLRGDYSSIQGGFTHEGIEDLTGGISVVYVTKDILDRDRFWEEELLRASEDRLFSCGMATEEETQGLVPRHAYAVLRAKECLGKRFVIVRNPWGDTEWTGAWSDGSKMWRGEWINVLGELNHTLGDDGQFVMEYCDFLDTFTRVARTLIFDSSWSMSSHWVALPPRPLFHPWTFGDINFHFTITSATPAVVVVSKLNEGYYRDVSGRSGWNVDFVVYKRGEAYGAEERSAHSILPYFRDTTCELDLEPGEYIVYARIDRFYGSGQGKIDLEVTEEWDDRKLGRVLTQQVQAYSVATNFDTRPHEQHIPRSLSEVIKEGQVEGASARGGEPRVESKKIRTKATTRDNLHEDERPPFLGLKVYTKRGCIVSAITSEIRD